jgi:hypothetical protein
MQNTTHSGLSKGGISLPQGKRGLKTSKLWRLQPKWIKELVNETEDRNPYGMMSAEDKAELEAQIAAMQQLEAESWKDLDLDEGSDDKFKFYLNTLNDDHEFFFVFVQISSLLMSKR